MIQKPWIILPRECQNSLPDVSLVGRKAYGLSELWALHVRTPRFGVITSEVFYAHLAQEGIKELLAEMYTKGLHDEPSWISYGKRLSEAIIKKPLPIEIQKELHILMQEWPSSAALALRASIVGPDSEQYAMQGCLDALLNIQGEGSLDDGIRKIFSQVFHPRTLAMRVKNGLSPLGARIALIVQQNIMAEASGLALSLASNVDFSNQDRITLYSTWGLLGGVAGRQTHLQNNAKRRREKLEIPFPIPHDTYQVQRFQSDTEIEQISNVDVLTAAKVQCLRPQSPPSPGTAMEMIPEEKQRDPSLTVLQARTVAAIAWRLEQAYGKPIECSFAFENRLPYILDVQPARLGPSRLVAQKSRIWDNRFLPSSLQKNISPLTHSLWAKVCVEALEQWALRWDMKPHNLASLRHHASKMTGWLEGKPYLELTALQEILRIFPHGDILQTTIQQTWGTSFSTAVVSTTKNEKHHDKILVSLLQLHVKNAPLDYKNILESIRTAHRSVYAMRDTDTILDVVHTLEKNLTLLLARYFEHASLTLMIHHHVEQLLPLLNMHAMPGVMNDLLSGDCPDSLIEFSKRLHALTRKIQHHEDLRHSLINMSDDGNSVMHEWGLFTSTSQSSDPILQSIIQELRALQQSQCALYGGDLTLESARLADDPRPLLWLLKSLLLQPEWSYEKSLQKGLAHRKKAEYAVEQALSQLSPLRSSGVKKKFWSSIDALRIHSRETHVLALALEEACATLRMFAFTLGDHWISQDLINHSADVLAFTWDEFCGVMQGTSPIRSTREWVALRKREMATHLPSLPQHLETLGPVLAVTQHEHWLHDEGTHPGDFFEVQGIPLSTGVVQERVSLYDSIHVHAHDSLTGVVVVQELTLRTLPLLLSAKAVVSQAGNMLSPAGFVLRALGIPCLVDVPRASIMYKQGEFLHVDGARGVIQRIEKLAETARPQVTNMMPEQFGARALQKDLGLEASPVLQPRQPTMTSLQHQPMPTAEWRVQQPSSIPIVKDTLFSDEGLHEDDTRPLMQGINTQKSQPNFHDAETHIEDHTPYTQSGIRQAYVVEKPTTDIRQSRLEEARKALKEARLERHHIIKKHDES